MDQNTFIGIGLIILCLTFVICLTFYSRNIINKLSEKRQASSRQIIKEMQNES